MNTFKVMIGKEQAEFLLSVLKTVDPARYFIDRVQCDMLDGKKVLVTTDGKRLHIIAANNEKFEVGKGYKFEGSGVDYFIEEMDESAGQYPNWKRIVENFGKDKSYFAEEYDLGEKKNDLTGACHVIAATGRALGESINIDYLKLMKDYWHFMFKQRFVGATKGTGNQFMMAIIATMDCSEKMPKAPVESRKSTQPAEIKIKEVAKSGNLMLICEGGVIEGCFSDIDLSVALLDYDVDGVDEEEVEEDVFGNPCRVEKFRAVDIKDIEEEDRGNWDKFVVNQKADNAEVIKEIVS
jgi:hypothetical protein